MASAQEPAAARRVRIGVCAMDKKARGRPMTEILKRLPKDIFEIVHFGDECICNHPIESWPVVDCLVAFFSSGFPLAKGIRYVLHRKPYCVNDLSFEVMMRDRRMFYSQLAQCGVPVPNHIVVSRDGLGNICSRPMDCVSCALDRIRGGIEELIGLQWLGDRSDLTASMRDELRSPSPTAEHGKLVSSPTEHRALSPPQGGSYGADEMGGASNSSGSLAKLGAASTAPAPAGAASSQTSSRSAPSPASPTIQVWETEDWLQVGTQRIYKPFVEKPVDAEDHNVRIYYPRRMGGGCKHLFRKRKDRSSEFHEHEWRVRRQGSYIYEEFLLTQGTDIKVYAVGPEYAHAEARKSPAVDGIVQRDRDGKELRFPIMLTREEKELARRVVLGFRQNVCGFDLLRTPQGSCVCDVNGWSFVKKSAKYYDDAASVMALLCVRAARGAAAKTPGAGAWMLPPPRAGPSLALSQPAPLDEEHPGHLPPALHGKAHPRLLESAGVGSSAPASVPASGAGASTAELDAAAVAAEPMAVKVPATPTSIAELLMAQESTSRVRSASISESSGGEEELRCVIAVVRHGDRTPKQKLKMTVRSPAFLQLHRRLAYGPRNEAVLKTARQLQMVLDAARQLIAKTEHAGDSDSDGEYESIRRLRSLRAVLEMGGEFSGINRKVQIKPVKWEMSQPRTEEEHSPAHSTGMGAAGGSVGGGSVSSSRSGGGGRAAGAGVGRQPVSARRVPSDGSASWLVSSPSTGGATRPPVSGQGGGAPSRDSQLQSPRRIHSELLRPGGGLEAGRHAGAEDAPPIRRSSMSSIGAQSRGGVEHDEDIIAHHDTSGMPVAPSSVPWPSNTIGTDISQVGERSKRGRRRSSNPPPRKLGRSGERRSSAASESAKDIPDAVLDLGPGRDVRRWDQSNEVVTEAMLVLKWGGVLTEAGRRQAEALGKRFRETLYQGESLLRLHSTYRHDCKIYAASEGRVQMTAAAFAKGLLALEGSLTPILASLVRNYNTKQLLDDASPAKDLIKQAKARLKAGLVRSWVGEPMHVSLERGSPLGGLPVGLVDTIAPAKALSTIRALRRLSPDPLECLRELHSMIEKLVVETKEAVHTALKAEVDGGDDRALRLLEDFEIASEAMGLSLHESGQLQGVLPPSAATGGGGPSSIVRESSDSTVGLLSGAKKEIVGLSSAPRATKHPHGTLSSSRPADTPDSRGAVGGVEEDLDGNSRLDGGSIVGSIGSPPSATIGKSPPGSAVVGPGSAFTANRSKRQQSGEPASHSVLAGGSSGIDGSFDSLPHSRVDKVIGQGLRGGRYQPHVHASGQSEGGDSRVSRADRSPKSTGRASTSAADAALLWHDDESAHARIVDGGKEAGGVSMSVLSRLLFLMGRWWRLSRDLYDKKKKKWELSKLADVYDNCKFDAQHNRDLGLIRIDDVFKLAVAFADCVIPQEYGVTPIEKSMVGCRIVHHLLRKIFFDLTVHKQSATGSGSGGRDPGVQPSDTSGTPLRPSMPSEGREIAPPLHEIADRGREWSVFRSSLAQAKSRVKRSAMDRAHLQLEDQPAGAGMVAPVSEDSLITAKDAETSPVAAGSEARMAKPRVHDRLRASESVESDPGGNGMWPEDYEVDEAVHQLDSASMAKTGYDDVNLIQHRVRTRVYFTSEAHLHSLVNVVMHGDGGLRSPHISGMPGYSKGSKKTKVHGNSSAAAPRSSLTSSSKPRTRPRREGVQPPRGGSTSPSKRPAGASGDRRARSGTSSAFSPPTRSMAAPSRVTHSSEGATQSAPARSEAAPCLLTARARRYLEHVPELDYCAHVVFLLYERVNEPVGSPRRHRCEIRLSPGACYSPLGGELRAPRTSIVKPSQQPADCRGDVASGSIGSTAGQSDATVSSADRTSPFTLPVAAANQSTPQPKQALKAAHGRVAAPGADAGGSGSADTDTARSQSVRDSTAMQGPSQLISAGPRGALDSDSEHILHGQEGKNLSASGRTDADKSSRSSPVGVTPAPSGRDSAGQSPTQERASATGGTAKGATYDILASSSAGESVAWSHDRVTYPVSEAEENGTAGGVLLAPVPHASAQEVRSGCLPVSGMVVLSDDSPLSLVEDALASAIMAPGAPDPREMRHTPAGERLRKANLRTPQLNMAVAGSSEQASASSVAKAKKGTSSKEAAGSGSS